MFLFVAYVVFHTFESEKSINGTYGIPSVLFGPGKPVRSLTGVFSGFLEKQRNVSVMFTPLGSDESRIWWPGKVLGSYMMLSLFTYGALRRSFLNNLAKVL